MSQRGAGTLAVILILAAVLVLTVVALNAVAAMRVKQVQHDWEATLGSWDQIMQRYPARQASASALELERLAAPLGIDLIPRYVDRPGQDAASGSGEAGQRLRPARESIARFEPVKQQVFGRYDTAHLERARLGHIDAPPQDLVDYMEQNAEALARLREHLLSSQSPLWLSDLTKLWAAPIPNLLGQLYLHKLLTSVALARLHAGDTPGALDHVEASYRLADSLRESPIVINQLILISATRMQLGVLRHVPDLPASWIRRMSSHDYRDSFLTAMKYEGWVWARTDGDVNEHVAWRRLAGPLLRPYNELCLADLSNMWRQRLANLERVEFLCDRDLGAEGASLSDIEIPRWNLLGDSLVPNLGVAIHRLARLELDLELTRLIQEAGEQRRAPDGDGSAEVVGERPSTSCPEERWIYSENDPGLRIELTRQISWPGQHGAILPTEAVLD